MIKVLKLTTGEELVCDLTKIDEMYKANRPAIIFLVPGDGKENSNRLSLMPYGMYLEDHYLIIHPDKIVWEGIPAKRMADHYSQLFGTGITVHNTEELENLAKFFDSQK